jgi:hypothetical protein
MVSPKLWPKHPAHVTRQTYMGQAKFKELRNNVQYTVYMKLNLDTPEVLAFTHTHTHTHKAHMHTHGVEHHNSDQISRMVKGIK